MHEKIEKVAVLGSGIMGAQIAGHLANAGIESYLFDIDQELADKGRKSLLSMKPKPLYNPKYLDLVTPCNYDEHLEKIKDVDWVIEAVVEQLNIKLEIYKKLTPFLKPSAILTSNTSGIPLENLTEKMSNTLREHFMITHFFNPPRYMQLLELVK